MAAVAAEVVEAIKTCCVCYEDYSNNQLLGCFEEAHYFCTGCVSGALQEPISREQLLNKVCIAKGCISPLKFTLKPGAISDPVFEIVTFLKEAGKVLKQELKLTDQRYREAENSLVEWRLAGSGDADAGSGTKKLLKEMRIAWTKCLEKETTLLCPFCDTAFADFDGCLALCCSTCGGHFCAICLEGDKTGNFTDTFDPTNWTHRHVQKVHGKIHNKELFNTTNDNRVFDTVRTLGGENILHLKELVSIASKMSQIPEAKIMSKIIFGIDGNDQELERLKQEFKDLKEDHERRGDYIQDQRAKVRRLDLIIQDQNREIRRLEVSRRDVLTELAECEENLRDCNLARERSDARCDIQTAKISELIADLSKLHDDSTEVEIQFEGDLKDKVVAEVIQVLPLVVPEPTLVVEEGHKNEVMVLTRFHDDDEKPMHEQREARIRNGGEELKHNQRVEAAEEPSNKMAHERSRVFELTIFRPNGIGGYKKKTVYACSNGPECMNIWCRRTSGLYHQKKCRDGVDCRHVGCTFYHSSDEKKLKAKHLGGGI
jgi:hypothetical protein